MKKTNKDNNLELTVANSNLEAAQLTLLSIAAIKVGLNVLLNSKMGHGSTMRDFIKAIPEAKMIESKNKENAKHEAKR